MTPGSSSESRDIYLGFLLLFLPFPQSVNFSAFGQFNLTLFNMPPQGQAPLPKQIPPPIPPPSRSKAERSESGTLSFAEAVCKCTCGEPDASEDWICCDGDDCPVGWYHMECVPLTEEPSGKWLCPRCSPTSSNDAELLRKERGSKRALFPKLGKATATSSKGAFDGGKKSGRVVREKAPVRAKKGIAIKKASPKKERSKWVGYVETSSEDEEDHKKSVEAAQIAVTVAEGRRTKAQTTQSEGRLTKSGAIKKTSKLAAGVKKTVRFEIPGDYNQYLPDDTEETPTVGSQSFHSPSNTPTDSDQDGPVALTVRYPSEVPSAPRPEIGAVMVVDTVEQGWTPIYTSVLPDGSISVKYRSSRTNGWCTTPLSAMRSTLPPNSHFE